MIDTIFQDIEGCIWYLSDILNYGVNTEAEYQTIGEQVLPRFVQHRLAGNLHKSEFYVHKTIFLVHVINS